MRATEPDAPRATRRAGLTPAVAVALAGAEWVLVSVALDVRAPLQAVAGERVVAASTHVYGVVFALALAFAVAGRGLLARTAVPAGARRRALALHGAAWLGAFTLLAALARYTPTGLGGWVGLAAVGVLAVTSLLALGRAAGLALRRDRLARAAGLAAAVAVPAWALAEGARALWRPLGAVTLSGAAALLALADGERVLSPGDAALGLDGFVVTVAPACSGYEGIGLVLAVTTGYLLLDRRSLRLARVWPLPLLAAIAVYGLNVARIAALVWLGARVSPDVALAGFHSKAGWVATAAVSLVTLAIARRLGGPDRSADVTYPAVPYVVPVSVLAGAGMLTGLAATTIDRLEVLVLSAAAASLALLAPRLPDLRPRHPWAAAAVGIGVYALWVAFEPAPAPARHAELGGALAALPAWERSLFWGVRFALSTAVVPLAEELAFRGYLMRRLSGAGPFEARAYRGATLTALALSSLAFGLLHGRWVRGTLAGLAFGAVARRTDRLGDAVVAHAVANALLAVQVALGGDLHLWW